MKDTCTVNDLQQNATKALAKDMAARDLGAILWSIPDADFHYIPEITVADADGKTRVVRVTGLYDCKGKVYAILEDVADTGIEHFYRHGIDVPPVVVTLTPTRAVEQFGVPTEQRGFTTQGSLEEWAVIADCYFEALNEQ